VHDVAGVRRARNEIVALRIRVDKASEAAALGAIDRMKDDTYADRPYNDGYQDARGRVHRPHTSAEGQSMIRWKTRRRLI